MKSRILFILLVLTVIGTKVNAQYVSIPDTNFGKWLHNNGYSGCMTGTSPHFNLDTTCNAVLTAQTMDCSSQNIHDLTGVQYFKGLVGLLCMYNPLHSLGTLPPNLYTLECNNDSISSIQAFPPNVVDIYCYNNQLTSLPPIPAGVDKLYCSGNQLTVLPTLPPNLTILDFSINHITNIPTLPNTLIELSAGSNQSVLLPATLPPSLEKLYTAYSNIPQLPPLPSTLIELGCVANGLTSLPALPAGLQILECSNNILSLPNPLPVALTYLSCQTMQLTSMPPLPSGLTYLYCPTNNLTSLPALPAGLTFLNCRQNQLTSLPSLPRTLTVLNCGYNHLQSIPDLPDSLFAMIVDSNQYLTCLPELKTIDSLTFYNTGLTCMPGYGNVHRSHPAITSYQLCDMFNPNGCHMAWNLSGNVYQDVDTDCYFSHYPDVRLQQAKLMLYQNGALQQQFFTSDGFYSFNLHNAWGTYVTKLDTLQIPFKVCCPASDSIESTISAIDSFFVGEDFALQCKQGLDVGAFDVLNEPKVIARPGTLVPVYITAGDLANQWGSYCATGVSGQVQVFISGQGHYQSIQNGALTPSNSSADTVTWAIPDFSAVNNFTAFNINLQIDSSATPGTQICFDVYVTPIAGDNNPANNHLQYCFTIVNALDPNEKEVFPAGDVDTSQEWLTYTVRFQNTGSAPAVNIYVTDTLSTNVDASSIQLVSYSHKNYTQVLEGGILRFNFPNINLPDSITDEPNSHGYVRYKVKIKRGLPYGTQIKNTANIFFDLNPAVVTNTTTTKLAKDTVILPGINKVTNQELAVTVYPNPANDLLNIATDVKGTMVIRLLDINGAEVMAQTSANPTTTLNISNLSKGMYFVEVRSNGMLTRKKVVKM